MILHQSRWVQGWHLNARNVLFGGHLLSWVDEDATMLAYDTLILDPGDAIVTVGMNHVKFMQPVKLGDRLICSYSVVHIGNKSLTVKAHIMSHNLDTPENNRNSQIFRALITMCRIDELNNVKSIIWGEGFMENCLDSEFNMGGGNMMRKDPMWAFVEEMLRNKPVFPVNY